VDIANRKFIIGTPQLLRDELKLKVEEKTGYYETDLCSNLEDTFTALDDLGYDFVGSFEGSRLVFRRKADKPGEYFGPG